MEMKMNEKKTKRRPNENEKTPPKGKGMRKKDTNNRPSETRNRRKTRRKKKMRKKTRKCYVFRECFLLLHFIPSPWKRNGVTGVKEKRKIRNEKIRYT